MGDDGDTTEDEEEDADGGTGFAGVGHREIVAGDFRYVDGGRVGGRFHAEGAEEKAGK